MSTQAEVRPAVITGAGCCLVTTNVLSGAGRVRWVVREQSQAIIDNGWRIFSDVDDAAYVADVDNYRLTDFNAACAIEPALVGIFDFPEGSDLQLVPDADAPGGVRVVDTTTGREIPPEQLYTPPRHRA